MKKIYRSRQDRMILGVCGGLGNYFKIDPTLLRLLFVFICVLTAILPSVIVYLIAAFVIPLEPLGHPQPHYTRLYRSRTDKKLAGLCGGLGELLKVDSTILRLCLVFLCIITAFVPLIAAYIIGWIFIPLKPLK